MVLECFFHVGCNFVYGHVCFLDALTDGRAESEDYPQKDDESLCTVVDQHLGAVCMAIDAYMIMV